MKDTTANKVVIQVMLRYLEQWVYLVHGEKQRVSPLAFLDG